MPKTATPAFMNKLFQRAGGKCECRGNHCSCHAPRVRCNAPLRRNQWAAHRQWAGGNYVLSNTKALCARCYRDIHGRKK